MSACTSDPEDPAASQPTAASERPDSTTTSAIGEATTPATRLPTNPGLDGGGINIGRGEMTETSVELFWTEADDVEAVYTVYRYETDGGDPTTRSYSDNEIVYSGDQTTTIDESVEPDTFYTYALAVTIDGVRSGGWFTFALTTTDTTAPAPVSELTAEQSAEGVLLSWSPSSEDVAFHSYAVFLVDGDELTYLGGGDRIDQTQFLDDDTTPGTRTYRVQAVDFHDNRSVQREVAVTIG